jgi:hypothetical protein
MYPVGVGGPPRANLSASVTKNAQPARSKPIRIEPINLPAIGRTVVCSGHPGGWRVHARRTKIPNGPGNVLLQLHRVTTSRRVRRCTTRVSPRKVSAPVLEARITGQGARPVGVSQAVPAVGLIFDAAPARSTGNASPSACVVSFPADIEIRSKAAWQISSDAPP